MILSHPAPFGRGNAPAPVDGPALRIDAGRQEAFVGAQPLSLTKTEFRLLECLLAAPGRGFSRAELMAAAIAGGAVVLERTIDQHVCGLRRKLRPLDVIRTVRGVGYCYLPEAVPPSQP